MLSFHDLYKLIIAVDYCSGKGYLFYIGKRNGLFRLAKRTGFFYSIHYARESIDSG